MATPFGEDGCNRSKAEMSTCRYSGPKDRRSHGHANIEGLFLGIGPPEMKYPKTAATGHAGEFFFAYQVAKVLGWPCRIFDIDIGL